MDASTLIHPLTADDLVAGAKIVGHKQRGDGPELQIHEVLAVRRRSSETRLPGALPHPDERIEVTVRDESTGRAAILDLKASTPLLVTHTLII